MHDIANNKYIISYDKHKKSKRIINIDANNLYGWSMARYLPRSGFKWLTQNEIKKLDVNTIREDNPYGCI